MKRLRELEGIGITFAQLLAKEGVVDIESLLDCAANPKQRHLLAAKTGIHPRLLNKWVCQADLFRIQGIGAEYSAILEAAGIYSISHLAQSKAESLQQRMRYANQNKFLRHMPPLEKIQQWIEQAQKLPTRVIP